MSFPQDRFPSETGVPRHPYIEEPPTTARPSRHDAPRTAAAQGSASLYNRNAYGSAARARGNEPAHNAHAAQGGHGYNAAARAIEDARRAAGHTAPTYQNTYAAPSAQAHAGERHQASAAYSRTPAASGSPSHTGSFNRATAADYATSNERYKTAARRPSARPTARNAKAERMPAYQMYGTGRTPATPYAAKKRTRSLAAAAGALALIALVVFGFNAWRASMPVKLLVNGQQIELPGKAASINDAFDAIGQPATAGDLFDVEGELLEAGKGNRFTATLNGEVVEDASAKLHNGDTLNFTDGAHTTEPSTVQENSEIPFNVVEEGIGPVHAVTQQGETGTGTTVTGNISGKTAYEVSKPAVDRVYRKYYPDTNGEKVIALTFDDGPWKGHTADILDILRENGAKATFFTVGKRIEEGEGAALVKRAASEGHQICTHTYDHASGSGQGVNMSFMTPEEQRQEIEKGLTAIKNATGKDASHVFRSPGGNYPIEVWKNTENLVSAEIGWDIDTTDWKRPGAEAIASQIKAATPGSIVLMHDGGGDRTQTVEALRTALPYLKEQGYKFITMDEMLKYPPQEQ